MSNGQETTYGYLDGEYAFSAALLLIMVNAALPHDKANTHAMHMALDVLFDMAGKGNTYLGSRHSLLLELQAMIGVKPTGELAGSKATPVDTVTDANTWVNNAEPLVNQVMETAESSNGHSPQQQRQPSYQDITFNFNINDDPGLWDGALGNIHINMDTGWIENTLRREISPASPGAHYLCALMMS